MAILARAIAAVHRRDSTPLGGAVPITFKLLSPAQRPLHVTRDLASFWKNADVGARRAAAVLSLTRPRTARP